MCSEIWALTFVSAAALQVEKFGVAELLCTVRGLKSIRSVKTMTENRFHLVKGGQNQLDYLILGYPFMAVLVVKF